jgi:hypothetical protein
LPFVLRAGKRGYHHAWKEPFDRSRYLTRNHGQACASMVLLALLSPHGCGWFSNIL